MGSITAYETANGKRYRVRYRKPDHSQTDKRGFRTKREAELFLAATEVRKATGEFIDATAARITIGELGNLWLRSQAHLKPSSYAVIEVAWRIHVKPKWGHRILGEIRHSEVQAWVSDLSARKSATVVIRAYGVLAGIIDVAVKDRRLPINPARGANLPRKSGKERHYLSHDQVQLLADESRANGTLVLFLAYTGLRWGEAVGLRVRSVDMLRRRVLVQANAVNVRGTIIPGTPKSHEARSVPFPAFLAEPIAKLCEGKTLTNSCSASARSTSQHRLKATAGLLALANERSTLTKISRSDSLSTTFGTPPLRSPFRPAQTSRPCSGCSATRQPR